MRGWRRLTVVFFRAAACVGGAIAGGSADSAPGADPGSALEGLFDRVASSNVRYGAVAIDLTTGSTLFRQNADATLVPASNQKLLVMAAGLDILGADFTFRTVLGLRGDDLVIVGDGDPSMGDAKLCARRGQGVVDVLDRWAQALIARGTHRIAGDLVIDDSVFDDQRIHPTWEESDLQKWYAAPVGGLNFHDNCIELTVWPAGQAGAPATWSVAPVTTLIHVVNRTVSTAPSRSPRGGVVISRPTTSFEYLLDGRCARRETLVPVPVPDPGLLFGDAMRQALVRAGVPVHGSIRRERLRRDDGTVGPDVRVVAEHRTPIADVLGRIGTDSQNLFAECLAKRIGYEHMRRARRVSLDEAGHRSTPVGSWMTGASAIYASIRAMGVDTTGLVIADASGLSRENRVSPEQLAAVLAHVHRQTEGKLFLDSLAVAGQEGSLRRRMRDVSGEVVGKTGTLGGVRSLSGYVLGDDGPRFAFSVIFNGITGSSAPYKRVQDEFCRRLVAYAP